jgi:low affinity Fe/Cu permease
VLRPKICYDEESDQIAISISSKARKDKVKKMHKNSLFTRFAKWASRATGSPWAFILAATSILVWAASYPLFKNFDTWQLVINTATTIVTFLMVFLIQNTQNRDTAAIHIKLDELIRCSEGAHNALLDLEEMEDKEIETMRDDYERLAASARKLLRKGEKDTHVPEVKPKSLEPSEVKKGVSKKP